MNTQNDENGGLCLTCYKPWCKNRKRGAEHCEEYTPKKTKAPAEWDMAKTDGEEERKQ